MSSVRQYYDSDFKGFIGPEGPMPLGAGEQPFDPAILWKILYNFDSRAGCVAFYVPSASASATVCKAVIDKFDWLDNIRKGLRIQEGFQGETLNDLSDCLFTGRVAMYVEGDISPAAASELAALAAGKQL